MGQVEHDARRNVGLRGLLLGLVCALAAAAGLAFSPQADARTVFSFDGERAFQVKPSTMRFGHDFSISAPNGWTKWGERENRHVPCLSSMGLQILAGLGLPRI